MATTAKQPAKTKTQAVAKIEPAPAALAILSQDTEEFAAILQDNMGGGIDEFTLSRIKMPTSGATFWQIPSLDGDKVDAHFDGVIVLQRAVKVYFAKRLGAGTAATPPDCYSADAITGVGTPGGDCAHCPLNAWKTKVNADGSPSGGKACADRLLLFILQPDSYLPTILSVPPTSIKDVRSYFAKLTEKKYRFSGVITRFTLTPVAGSGNPYSRLVVNVAPDGYLSPEDGKRILNYSDALKPLLNGFRPQIADVS